MVLANRVTAIAPILFTNRRTIVHLHVHVGVIAMPSPAMFVRCATPRVGAAITALPPSRVGAAITALPPSRVGAAITALPPSRVGGVEEAFVRRSAEAFALAEQSRPATPAFVPSDLPTIRLRRRAAQRRGLTPSGHANAPVLPMLMLSPKRRPTLAGAHADLPGRLRRQSMREELSSPGRTTVLARMAAHIAKQTQNRDNDEREFSVAPRSEWAAPAAPAVNVEALTSQVIQQLDRRLLAYRERMGRV
jgi:hypothetical protein